MNWTIRSPPRRRSTPCLDAAPVIPVLTIDRLEDAVPLARALADNGLPVLEITLRTPVALRSHRPDRARSAATPSSAPAPC